MAETVDLIISTKNQGQKKKDVSVRDGKLYKEDKKQGIVISPKSETTDNN